MRGDARAAAAYREFLKAGSSLYPLEALKLAGVDMTTPQAVEDTFAVLADMVTRLDELTEGQKPGSVPVTAQPDKKDDDS